MIREELSINIQCIDTLLDELPGNTYEPYICNPLFFVAGLFLSLLSLGVLIFFLIFNITNQKKEQLYFFFFLIYFQHERCDFIFISVLTHFFFFLFLIFKFQHQYLLRNPREGKCFTLSLFNNECTKNYFLQMF